MPEPCLKVRDFIQFMTRALAKDLGLAQLRVVQTRENVWRFRLLLARPDVARMIGRNGMTISAMRSLIKAALEDSPYHIKFEIMSHEEAFAKDQAEAS